MQVAKMADVPICLIVDAKCKAKELEYFGNQKRSKGSHRTTTITQEEQFVHRFCQLDLPSLLLKDKGSKEETRTKLLALLALEYSNLYFVS
jgi:hypothetical protein